MSASRIENHICALALDLVVDLTGFNNGHLGFMGRNNMNFRGY